MDAAKSKASSNFGFLKGMQSSSQPTTNPFLRSLSKPGGTVRNHIIAFFGEFIGTFLFLFFAFTGTQVANSQTQNAASTSLAQGSNPAQLLYISLCFGFSLAVNAWVFFRISGGLFNPAVTFGMCLIGAVPWLRGLIVFIAQMTGSMAAAGLVSALYPGPFSVRTTLGAGTSKTQGLFIEMFLTAMLVFTIFMLAAEKHKGTFIAPVGIGLALFIAELGGVYYTGGSLNPARSFGPDVVVHTFEDYHWIYWLGPLLGSLLASAIYTIFKTLDYSTANPGQDFDENEDMLFDPERGDVRRPSPLTHVVMDEGPGSKHTSMTMAVQSESGERRGSRPISSGMTEIVGGGGGGGKKAGVGGGGGSGGGAIASEDNEEKREEKREKSSAADGADGGGDTTATGINLPFTGFSGLKGKAEGGRMSPLGIHTPDTTKRT